MSLSRHPSQQRLEGKSNVDAAENTLSLQSKLLGNTLRRSASTLIKGKLNIGGSIENLTSKRSQGEKKKDKPEKPGKEDIRAKIGEILLSNNLNLLAFICHVPFVGEVGSGCVNSLLALVQTQGGLATEEFLYRLLREKFRAFYARTHTEASLKNALRDNGMEMLFLGAYVRSEATSYLTETLAKPVRDLLPTLDKCEIDPFRAPPEDLAANEERLQKAAMTILSAIIQSHRKIPKTIRRLCRFLRKEIEATLFDAFNAGNVLNRTISDSQSSLVAPPEEPQNTSPTHGGGGLTRRRSTRSSFARTIERRNSEDADTMLSPITEKTMYATASQILSEPVPDPSADATNSANVEPSNQTHQPEETALQLDSFTLHAIINQMDNDITDQPHQQMNTCSSVEAPSGDKLPENNPTTSPDSPSKRSVSSAESYYSSPTRSTFSRRSMGGLSEDRSVRSIHSDDESGGSPSKMKRTNVSLRRNRNIVKKQVKGKTIVYSIADQVLASFLFLRFYVPALMQPELYHLLEASEVTPPIFRGLVLCGKVLVSLCNDVDTKTKEMHLLPSIQFLQEQRQRVKFFLGVITKDEEPEVAESESEVTTAPLKGGSPEESKTDVNESPAETIEPKVDAKVEPKLEQKKKGFGSMSFLSMSRSKLSKQVDEQESVSSSQESIVEEIPNDAFLNFLFKSKERIEDEITKAQLDSSGDQKMALDFRFVKTAVEEFKELGGFDDGTQQKKPLWGTIRGRLGTRVRTTLADVAAQAGRAASSTNDLKAVATTPPPSEEPAKPRPVSMPPVKMEKKASTSRFSLFLG